MGDASLTLDDLFKGTLSDCPDCPADGWVGLARVEFDDQGSITAIDNCGCRRMLVSFSGVWRQCTAAAAVTITKMQPDFLTQGDEKATLKMTGTNFQEGIKLDLGRDIKVIELKVEQGAGALAAVVTVSETARVGERRITVTNPDGSFGTGKLAIRARARPTPGPKPTPAPTPAPAPIPPRPTPRPRDVEARQTPRRGTRRRNT
jgi:hypothetical protein